MCFLLPVCNGFSRSGKTIFHSCMVSPSNKLGIIIDMRRCSESERDEEKHKVELPLPLHLFTRNEHALFYLRKKTETSIIIIATIQRPFAVRVFRVRIFYLSFRPVVYFQ